MHIRQLFSALICGGLIGISATTPSRAATLALADLPLFLVAIKPSIMVMLDNSGSMKEEMYDRGFDPSVDYYGIFETTKTYVYDPTIAVNSAAYVVSVDTSRTGAFVESNCIPSAADFTCWSGRFLNWMTTRRIDASRMVMVGGKLESTSSFAYGGSYEYKIVGNNEYADRDIARSYASSASWSPVPDGASIMVYSPADASGGSIQTTYDPYAKMAVSGGGGIIYNTLGTAVGEFGSATIDASIDANGALTSWSSISLQNTYAHPVVIARPPSQNGGDPSVVRIKDVTASGFQMTMQEWEYRDGNHISEDVSYIVMEAGNHVLPGSIDVKVGTVAMDEIYASGTCGPARTDFRAVSFSAPAFTSTPVVISSIMTFDGSEAVTSRVWDVSSSGFSIALQEELQPVTEEHAVETIGYMAFEQGSLIDAVNEWAMEAGSYSGMTHNYNTINFYSALNGIPSFLAAMQTKNDNDTATLRLDAIDSSSATLQVEEEESCDSDVSHTAEDVGYVALRGSAELNVALAITAKPTGLLQDIADGVRLGVSFYRYNPNANDIYNQNVQGGTLRFKIPNNPFVRKPTDTNLLPAEQGYVGIDGYIGTPIDDIVNAVNSYPLVWGTTPLAENLWEVIQYFEQDTPYYTDVISGFSDFDLADDVNPERDPFYYPEYSTKLFCANPSVVIFTDGEPYKDADIPAAIVDYDEDSHSDDVGDTDINAQGKDNLDDVAYWAFCDKSEGPCPVPGTPEDGSRDLRDDLSGDQYLTIYTVGFAGGAIRPVLQDTADNAGGLAYAAEDGKALKTALEQAFTAAMSRSSASSVAVNTGSITGTSKLYQAIFDSTDWSGDIEAYGINSDGSVAITASWKASDQLPAHADRMIFTYDGTDGQPFKWDDIPTLQGLLGSSDVLDYVRGDQSNEESQGGLFRNRNKLLGDFIHSAPVWVGPPSFHYPSTWSGYSAFQSTYSTRTPVVYAGANDGMLHAFDAADGTELFAYVPSRVYANLASLTNPDYAHKYFVDGSPAVVDAYYSNAWHTVLAGGLNAGGQAIYALDVTNPSAFASDAGGVAKVLWEFDDSDDADLGYTFSQPNIVKLQSGAWAAVFGNGYNNTESDGSVSATGNAVLYVVNIADGSLINTKIDTGEGTADDPTGNARPNGLATVAPVDVNGDSVIDYVYAGDLFGNLWKFYLSNSSWGVAYAKPLFTACHGNICTSSNAQPITTRPQVGLHPSGQGYMVYFGTGKYFENNDDTSVSQVTQSFYGIWDKDEKTLASSVSRSSLQVQEIIKEVDLNSDSLQDYRITSQNPVDWSTQNGWYIDLINTDGGNTDNKGERQISNSILRNGRIIFTTMLPEDSPCSAGGTGWLMEIDAATGGRLEFVPFDVNNDGSFDEDDYISADINGDGVIGDGERLPPSGVKSEVGIIPTPAILVPTDDPPLPPCGEMGECKYLPGTSGDIQVVEESSGPGSRGRQSWLELAF